MKYLVLIGDGMADYPRKELGGKTPLEFAKTPNMDFIADCGVLGTVRTIPEGYPPGSDVANLSLFDYDPKACYSGRLLLRRQAWACISIPKMLHSAAISSH